MNQVNLDLSLIMAANNNDLQLVITYLKAGANSMATDVDGNTALHFAVQKKNKDIVSVLLKSGIDEHLKNKQGKSAIDFANQDLDLAAWFIQCSRAIRLAQLKEAIQNIAILQDMQKKQNEILATLVEEVKIIRSNL